VVVVAAMLVSSPTFSPYLQVYGVRILDGSLKASDVVRVTRDEEVAVARCITCQREAADHSAMQVLGEAKLTSLRHFKEQVFCMPGNPFISSCY
jgi:hypothetical protein